MSNVKTVVYDPINHFQLGFHKPVIDNLPPGVIFRPGTIDYFLKESMVADKNSKLARDYLSIGRHKGND